MSPDVYICSKPLQFFNIKNIGKLSGGSDKRILIVFPNFFEGNIFVDNIKKFDPYWDEIITIQDKADYYNYIKNHRINYLIVENDASVRMFAFMLIAKLKNQVKALYVFEEGIGSYRNDLHTGFNKLLRILTLIGPHYGASIFCKHIILYEPEFYNKKFHSRKAIPFSIKFIDGLKKHQILFHKLCGDLPPNIDVLNQKILLYITNHSIDRDILSKMIREKNSYDVLYIKPHPHIKILDCIPKEIRIIQTNILMEFIISELLCKDNNLTIWHQASTSLIYFTNKVKEKNFIKFPIYDEFMSYRSKYSCYSENTFS